MRSQSPTLLLVAGPNGAGKSTLAPSLLRERLAVLDYVNADTIARGLSAFSPESQAFAAGRVMLRRLRDLARARQCFGFETTLASRSYGPWLRKLGREGYQIHVVYVWLRTAELAVARVAERVRLGGHAVPEDVVRRRYQRGVINFLELYSPMADRWCVVDNSGAGSPPIVASGRREVATLIPDRDLWHKFRNSAHA